jgi:DNA mismatch repair protein MutS2
VDRNGLEVLEFGKVREILSDLTRSELGRAQALKLSPELGRDQVELVYDQLDELSRLSGEPPLSQVEALGEIIKKGVLTPVELLKVLNTIKALRLVQEWFSPQHSKAPRLSKLISSLQELKELEAELSRSVEPPGQLRDDASPELKRLRSRLKSKRSSLLRMLEAITLSNPGCFQETRVRFRDNRFVLPLKAAAKGRFSGVVLGSSNKGKTLFVEPAETLDEQNEYSELLSKERAEVRRILRSLSNKVHLASEAIQKNLKVISELDLLYARLDFGRRFDGVRPEIVKEGLSIREGRHPLLRLARSDVVGLNLELAPETRVLLISGPNAGGKTVVLKTIGIFSLMLRAGLPIPAQRACLPFYSQIFAHIGDESSIELGLSSFSAFLVQVKEILERAGPDTLVLIDELGSSTGVEEGAGLGMAVLRQLRDRGAQTIAVSHLTPILLRVEEAEGMLNGAMEFKGRPTYKLILGQFGAANALALAEQLGFPVELLSEAKGYLKEEWVEASRYRERLQAELEKVSKEAEALSVERAEALRMRREYESKLSDFSDSRSALERRLLNEQAEFLSSERRRIEALIRRLKNPGGIRAAQEHFQAELDRIQARSRALLRPAVEVKPGDWVRSERFGRQGEVLEVNGEEAQVQFGTIRVRLPLCELSLTQPLDRASRPKVLEPELDPFDPRISLRGLTQAEAWERLDQFLDMASLRGAKLIWVVHGKGQGILRQMVWEYLSKDRRVERFRLGTAGEGGSGVTAVELKE